jgi:hypothetical protein
MAAADPRQIVREPFGTQSSSRQVSTQATHLGLMGQECGREPGADQSRLTLTGGLGRSKAV